jgi:hypothetical protein
MHTNVEIYPRFNGKHVLTNGDVVHGENNFARGVPFQSNV